VEIQQITSEKAQEASPQELFQALSTSSRGLSTGEADARLARFGPNALEEKKVNPLVKFLGYFWGPIPWMIDIAAVLSLVVRHWADFTIIVLLLLFNALVVSRRISRPRTRLKLSKRSSLSWPEF